MVKCVVKLKNCRIGTKIGVVVDMDPGDKKAERQKGKKYNNKKSEKSIKKKYHSERPTPPPPMAFSVPKRNKKLEVVRRRKRRRRRRRRKKVSLKTHTTARGMCKKMQKVDTD